MRKFILAILALSFLFTSCEQDEKESNTPASAKASDYFPLAIGNYWVYEIFEIDTLGNETNTGIFDSVFVSGTELIKGDLFYKIEGGNHMCLNQSVRDSSGYLISSGGLILFAPNDFSDTLDVDLEMITEKDTLYMGYSNMERVSEKLSVGAGSFDVLLCRTRYYVPVKGGALRHRQLLDYRAPKVGVVVKQCTSAANPLTWEGRLVRYKIQ